MNRGQESRQQASGGRVASAAGRAVRWSGRLIGLVIAVLLVVGIGVGVRSPEPQGRVYSASEQAQLDAEDRFRALAEDARAAAAVQPALADRLTAAASDLDVQADAVALPRSPTPAPTAPSVESDETTANGGTATGRTPSPSGDSPGPGSTPATPPVDGMLVLAMLRESALESLGDAVSAEPGAARVLASAGANQWWHASALGQVLGVSPDLPPLGESVGTAAEDQPGASTPARAEDGTIAGECAGTPLGPDADRQALLAAKNAEDQARYGYEVAAALLEDRAGALARSAEHDAAADAAADRLAALCVPAAPAPAGFTISAAFRADPSRALRDLEQDHVALYAGLVSAVSPAVRPWAVTSLNAAVQRSIGAGAALEPLPGLDDGPEGTAGAAPTSASVVPTPQGPPAPVEAADDQG
ncbi:DUF4439 domain-containing protein [Arthrobacter sp. NamB2]|uniref:DUF4439 domain-containing protein n=1 Tax=Arthrobacter sp. NamB2 TaxID=2576035 RepID=UPI0016745956|nr:DUF4439 domain-containing protein [Arthrobacter sp. NamB2]